MKACEHEPILRIGETVCVCYYCGCMYEVRLTPRDEVDAFVLSLKGVAR